MDIVRGTAIFVSMAQLAIALEWLLDEGCELLVVRAKDRLNTPTRSECVTNLYLNVMRRITATIPPTSHSRTQQHAHALTCSGTHHHPSLSSFGYMDMLLNVHLKGSYSYHIGELQLHLEGIHAIKPQTHRTYGVLRTVGWEDHEDDDAPNLGEGEDEDDGRILSGAEIALRAMRRVASVLPRRESRTGSNGGSANGRSRGWRGSITAWMGNNVAMPRPSNNAPPSGSSGRSQTSAIEMGSVARANNNSGGGVVIENPILENVRRRSGGSGKSKFGTDAGSRVRFHDDSAASEHPDGAVWTGAAEELAAFDDVNLNDLGDLVVEVVECGSDDDEAAVRPSPWEGTVANEGHYTSSW